MADDGRPLVRFTSTLIGSLLLAMAAAMLAVRWGDTTTAWGAAAAGLTLFAIGPLLAGGALAWLGGSTSLRTATVAIGLGYLLTVSPVEAVLGCGGHRADDELTVLTANILRYADQPAGLADTIAASDADIVVLQEVNDTVHRSLRANEVLADYGYWSSVDRAVTFGPRTSAVLVLSKLDGLSTERLDIGAAGAADIVFALPPTIGGTEAGTVTLTGVHVNAPSRPRKVQPWRDQLAALADHPTDRPAIMAGDFNATEDHRPFRHLLGQGWTDVHQVKGCGFGLTFPVNGMLPFPVMRLDHVLVTDHFEVLNVELVEETNGSDHRPVLTHVRLRAADS